MGDLSPHFDHREFLEHGSGARKDPPAEFIAKLERLRELVGRPIRIVSGYRSPAYNKRVGGARNSRHIHGDAADLERGLATLDQAKQAGFGGIGYCGRWVVHVDDRPVSPRRGPVIFEDC